MQVNRGEVVALMGPNGSGKTSLSFALMGHPRYKIDSGKIRLMGEDITSMTPTERAKLGLFLSFQYPSEVPGVSAQNFLRTAYNSVKDAKMGVMEFSKLLAEKLALLGMDRQFVQRGLNEGFSGGEKKRMEILQMSILEPKMAILDETDSGLDVDSLRTVAFGISKLVGANTGVLLITHYQRILNYVTPDKVYVLIDGEICSEGGKELAQDIEKKGYDFIRRG